MPNEFIARNGIISKGNIIVTGSVTATGGIITSGSLIHTGSVNISGSLTVTGSTLTSGSTVNSGSYRFYSEQDSAFLATVSGSRSSNDIAFNFRKIGEPTAGSRHTMIVEGTGGNDNNLYFGVNAVGSNPGAIFAVKGNGSVNINMPNPTVNYGGLAGGGWISSYPSLLVQGIGTTSATTSLLVQNANASASLSVLDNGYVGIGTNAPAQALDVNGTFRIAQPSTVNAFTFAVTATTVQISNDHIVTGKQIGRTHV